MELDKEYFDKKFQDMNEKFQDMNEKFQEIDNRLNSFIDLTSTLIKQNIRLSNNSGVDMGTACSSPSTIKGASGSTKKLFYEVIGEEVHITGNGTFDVKDTLREISRWNKDSKAWVSKLPLEEIKKKYDNISVKS